MKNFCVDASERSHLLKLVKLIRSKALTGTQAWSCFSTAPDAFKYKINGEDRSIQLTSPERNTYKRLRKLVQSRLFEKFGRSCVYCRRPVGHYGYSWHIEHVLPKSIYSASTFSFSNLAVGCVDCNRWKGVRVDPHVRNRAMPIINPLCLDFDYSKHLRFLQINTEEMSFVKYHQISKEGIETFSKLNFSEIERSVTIDSLDGFTADLHSRLSSAMSTAGDIDGGDDLIELLTRLKSAMYRRVP